MLKDDVDSSFAIRKWVRLHTLRGWKCSTENCRRLEDLPSAAMDYLRFLAELMEVPIAIVSLGASRDQTIVVEDPIHGPKRALLSQ